VFAGENKNSAQETLPSMEAADNSGELPTIKVEGEKISYTAGRHQITITAMDSSGNTAVCRFFVYVRSKSWMKYLVQFRIV
jgi:hypothetical protein